MSSKFVRIKCRPRDAAEFQKYDIMLEAVVDGDKLLPIPWLGIAKFHGMFPFKLELSGSIDFGSAYEDSGRYWQANIYEKSIRSGEIFTITGPDEDDKTRDCIYEIYDVQNLPVRHRDDGDYSDFGLGGRGELDLDDPDV